MSCSSARLGVSAAAKTHAGNALASIFRGSVGDGVIVRRVMHGSACPARENGLVEGPFSG